MSHPDGPLPMITTFYDVLAANESSSVGPVFAYLSDEWCHVLEVVSMYDGSRKLLLPLLLSRLSWRVVGFVVMSRGHNGSIHVDWRDLLLFARRKLCDGLYLPLLLVIILASA